MKKFGWQVATEKDWEKLIHTAGLVIVDIYCAWFVTITVIIIVISIAIIIVIIIVMGTNVVSSMRLFPDSQTSSSSSSSSSSWGC